MALDRHTVAAAAAACLLPLSTALAGDATTTRIETRPFYGATVTLEHGVRVFRALPPHGNVIINPYGATPLHLGIEQHRSYNYNYGYGPGAAGPGRYPADAAPAYDSYGYVAPPYGYGHGGWAGRHRGFAARPGHAHRAHHGHGGHRGHGGKR